MSLLNRLFLEEDGATAVEYAVIVGLIILVVAAGINAVGGVTSTSFADSRDKIEAATGGL